MAHSIYDFSEKTIKGELKPLSTYKGKVALIVNVASKCGLTPQYKGLEELFETYRERGFVILGFPANNFAAQEPASNSEIAEFCETQFNVKFDLFAKISVKGDDMDPLYQYLTTEAPHASEIKWNFQKFLVDRNGQVVANIDPRTEPKDIAPMIEKLL
jgi:glutathione peroxidase